MPRQDYRSLQEPIDIEPHLEELCAYLTQNRDIAAAYLYGSYGTAAQTPLSDVDLAILFFSHAKRDLKRVMEIESELSKICQTEDINLLVLNEAPVLIQHRVISTGRIIHERDPKTVNDFHEAVFKRYADFMPDYLTFCREYDRSLQEAYNGG